MLRGFWSEVMEISLRVHHRSVTKTISVDVLELSSGEQNEVTGSVKWKQKIAAGGTYSIRLAYAVWYPKYSTLVLE
jgi:hypothetical protein